VFRETSSAGITILAGWKMYEHTLVAASYRQIWEFGVYACDSKNGDRDKQSGEIYFTVVDDNSGQDVTASDCPDHVATMVFAGGVGPRTQYGHECYDYLDEAVVEPEPAPAPCRARLTDFQIKCLESYFAGQSNMDVCMAGFETVEAGDDSELLWAWANATSWSDAHAGPMWEPIRGEDEDGLVEGDVSSGDDQASTNMTQEAPHDSFAARPFATGLPDIGYTTVVVGIMALLLLYC
jgi:hypothetical protein